MRIGPWLVQPSLNLLTRDEASVRVRAQLMDLLLCLASRPGKVFGKEEIVADVWEGRWVAESALSRCVAELRAAIGDEAQQPRVIQTINKRGYRLIAPVEVVTAAEPALPWAAAAIARRPSREVQRPRPAVVLAAGRDLGATGAGGCAAHRVTTLTSLRSPAPRP